MAFGLGTGSLLTDPNDDRRSWFRAHLYADGEAVLTAAGEPDASRELVSSLRVCAGAAYDSTRHTP